MEPLQLDHSPANLFAEVALVCGSVAALNVGCGASRAKVALLVASGAIALGRSRAFRNMTNRGPHPHSTETGRAAMLLLASTQGILCLYDLKDCFSLLLWPSKKGLAVVGCDMVRYCFFFVRTRHLDERSAGSPPSLERMEFIEHRWNLIDSFRVHRTERAQLLFLAYKGQARGSRLHRALEQVAIERKRPRICWAPLLKGGRSSESLVHGTRVPDFVIKRVMRQMSPYLLMTKAARVNRQWLRLASEVLVEKLHDCHPLTDPRFADYRTRYRINVYSLPELTPVTLWSHHLPALKGSVPFWKDRRLHKAKPSKAPLNFNNIKSYVGTLAATEELRSEIFSAKVELLSWRPHPFIVLGAHPDEGVALLKHMLHCRGTFEGTTFCWLAAVIKEEDLKVAKILLDGGANVMRPNPHWVRRDANYAKLLLLLEGKPLIKSNVRKQRLKSSFEPSASASERPKPR